MLTFVYHLICFTLFSEIHCVICFIIGNVSHANKKIVMLIVLVPYKAVKAVIVIMMISPFQFSFNCSLLFIGLVILWIHTVIHFIFSCDQAALWMVQSVCLSVCLWRLFHYVPIIVSSWNFQELLPMTKWCPCKRSRSEVKSQGHRGQNPT